MPTDGHKQLCLFAKAAFKIDIVTYESNPRVLSLFDLVKANIRYHVKYALTDR